MGIPHTWEFRERKEKMRNACHSELRNVPGPGASKDWRVNHRTMIRRADFWWLVICPAIRWFTQVKFVSGNISHSGNSPHFNSVYLREEQNSLLRPQVSVTLSSKLSSWQHGKTWGGLFSTISGYTPGLARSVWYQFLLFYYS